MEKTFVNQSILIEKDTKKWENSRAGQGEDYTTGCLLNCKYIKNHYRLIAADLSEQKELDVGPKAIQQIEFVWHLKDPDDKVVANESLFVLTILEKIKKWDKNFPKDV